MKWFYNLKINTKLLTSFIVVAIIAVIVGTIGIANIKALDNSDAELYEKTTVPIQKTSDILNNFQHILINVRMSLLVDDAQKVQAYSTDIIARQTNILQNLEELGKIIVSDTLYQEVVTKNNNFVNQMIDFQSLIKDNRKAEALLFLEDTHPYRKSAIELENAIVNFQQAKLKDAENKVLQNTKQADLAIVLMVIVIAAGVVIAMGLGLFLSAIISKPMLSLTEAAEKLANGDLNLNIKATSTDEIGKLMLSFNKMADILKHLIDEVGALTKAAVEGNLDLRGNTQRFNGSYSDIIAGFNQTLDFIAAPVKEATGVLKQMSNGNLQARVTGDYHGDHAVIKNALNETLEGISSYVNEISSTLTEMAHSNLVVGIDGEYKGDFSQIKDALNLIITSLNEVLGEVNGAAQQVAAGSRQVSDSSMSLSQGATEQASSIEELTASIEQIASQTKQNAKSANEAKNIADTAKVDAAEGNQQMQEMLKAMEEINDSSNNISKIIKVIDEIAFQTNILALNAAVEAARAGQHGKGFAVVAEEVRNLAARSANAAKETTAMIEGSIKKVEGGTKIANATAQALDNIVKGVAKAARLVSDIAVASDEQAIGVEQINQGIIQIATVVQNTSATSEETAAASEELSSQAEMLKKQVGRFKIKDNRASFAYAGIEGLNPEVLRMLENMNGKNGKYSTFNDYKETAVTRPNKMITSDNEFGKY